MTSDNFAICHRIVVGGGLTRYLWQKGEIFERVEDPMPAVFDYDKTGKLFRIEILFLQERLKSIGGVIHSIPISSDTEIVLQVGRDNPVSLLLWIDEMYEKSAKHTTGDAWVLVNESGEAAGLDIILPL